MPTVSELITRGNRLIDDTFDNINWVDWFNQCQNEDLADIIYLPTKTTLTKNNEGFFVLPDDYKDSLIIRTEGVTANLIGNELEVEDNNIDELDIIYNKIPTKIENIADQVPDIPEQFHDVYIFYGAKMAMLVDEEHERYNFFNAEYLNSKLSLKKYMDKRRIRPSRWQVIR